MRAPRRILTVGVALMAMAVAVSIALPGVARAQLVFGQASVLLTENGGAATHQAGGHPNLKFTFRLPEGVTEEARDIELALPRGMVGDAAAVVACPVQAFLNADLGYSLCPEGSQIGYARLKLGWGNSFGNGQHQEATVAVFNLAHGPETPALFGFQYLGVPALITVSVRPGDYGITSGTLAIPQVLRVLEAELEIWGVPGDPSHDTKRQPYGYPFIAEGESHPSPVLPVPFLRSPTTCEPGGLSFLARLDSYTSPGVFDQVELGSDAAGRPAVLEGCEQIHFEPSLTLAPTSAATAAPTGLQVKLTVPQNESPNGVATSDVKSVRVTFPQGMSVSPSSASGLGACSVAQIAIGSNADPTCPESSKIGSVQIKTPLLEEELEGGLYLARQKENPFGTLLAVYLAVKGPGFWLKLPGRVTTDPTTGQVSVSFAETPQLPFEELRMDLKTGPRAPLAMPGTCGTYAIRTEVVPWSGTAPVTGESTFTVDQNCSTGSFAPGLKAGTQDPTAGSFSPFTLEVTRNEGEANLSRISATLPPGLLAKLRGVPLCGSAEAATGNCPAGSQVGTTTIGAGPGPNPVYVPEAGRAPTAVYLGGPYQGAPYSLVVKVPAQAGPFDLGTVVVRNALRIDPFTTQVTAESDPLPQILEGIPISYRDLRVEVTRPQFTVNPTNCSQFQVTSVLTSATGQSSSPKAPFAAANCERLAFEPSLKLQLKGQTKRTGHPALKAVLTYPRKGSFANIARAQVTLPRSEFLDQSNLDKTCTRPVLLAGNCPKTSIYGRAKAFSPLLGKPLTGPVYLVGGFGYKLPALVADLQGQIHVILAARIDSGKDKGLRATFEAVPDAPVSRFVLEMKGGRRYGLLINSEDVCRGTRKVDGLLTAQNGKVARLAPGIATGCGGGKGAKGKRAAKG